MTDYGWHPFHGVRTSAEKQATKPSPPKQLRRRRRRCAVEPARRGHAPPRFGMEAAARETARVGCGGHEDGGERSLEEGAAEGDGDEGGGEGGWDSSGQEWWAAAACARLNAGAGAERESMS